MKTVRTSGGLLCDIRGVVIQISSVLLVQSWISGGLFLLEYLSHSDFWMIEFCSLGGRNAGETGVISRY